MRQGNERIPFDTGRSSVRVVPLDHVWTTDRSPGATTAAAIAMVFSCMFAIAMGIVFTPTPAQVGTFSIQLAPPELPREAH
jgi:hypothetical protein